MVAVALFVVMGVFPYLTAGLVVPLPGLIVLMACWAAGLWLTSRLALRRPLLAPLMIPAGLAFWWAYITAGERLFGWTG
jgi:hypothetical protein